MGRKSAANETETKSETVLAKSDYKPGPKTLKVLKAYDARRASTPVRANIKYTADDVMEADHEDHLVGWMLMMENMGTVDITILRSVTHQLVEATQKNGRPDEQRMQYAMAHLQSIGAKDERELMLAVQMTLVHLAVARAARSLHGADSLEQIPIHSNSLSKLTRTFAAQVDTLKRYRGKGEQRVIVEHQHVHVHPGAQAVVGNVNHGGSGEGANKKDGQPHERAEPLRISERSPVPCDFQADRVPMQSAGNDGLERVSLSRRARGPALRAVE